MRWGVAIFLVLLWGGIWAALAWLDRLHEENARRDTDRLAQALALQTGQFLQNTGLALAALGQRLATVPLEPAAVARVIDEMRPRLPAYIEFGVFDAEGRGVAASIAGFRPGRSFADRDYFRAQREGAGPGLYIGEPIVGRTVLVPRLPASLRIDGGDGRLRGVLLASIDIRKLASEVYALFPLGEQGLIVLVRTTPPMRIVARHPDFDAWFGKEVDAPIFSGIARNEAQGTIKAAAQDGIVRLASWRQIDGYPLALLVGVGRADIAAAQQTAHGALLGGGLLASLLALLLARSLAEGQRRSAEALAAQQALIESQRQDARLLAAARDQLERAQRVARIGSWHLDIAANRLEWSAETYRIFGVANGIPLSYEDFLACVHPDDRAAVDAAWQAALRGEPYDIVHRIVVAGEIKWVREQAELTFDAQGRLASGIGTVQDVTQQQLDQIALEEARRAAEAANRAKSEFLANMSHEIRTPMNAILGLTELVRAGPLLDDQRDMLATVHTSAQALLAMLNDILDYSKLEADRMMLLRQPLSVAEVVRDAGRLFAAQCREKGLTLDCDIDPAIPPLVLGDPLRLRQVLVNLVGNAVKFTAQGGISVRAELVEPHEHGGWLRFSVSDTGIGIAPEQIGQIFEPFVQADGSIARRFGGTGLGLAICRKLVALMGGKIDVTSAPGQGATFCFTLPVARDEAPAPFFDDIPKGSRA